MNNEMRSKTPLSVIRSKDLSLGARALYMVTAEMSPDDQIVYHEYDADPVEFIGYVQELIDIGYVRVEYGKHWKSKYFIRRLIPETGEWS